jgi:hypothetical protein
MASKSDFLITYGKVVARSWEDKEYHDRLVEDPRAVLSEAGLTIPAGIDINVVEFSTTGTGGGDTGGDNTPDALYGSWEKAAESGSFTLPLPTTPPEAGDVVLYDEELESVAGGGAVCCCPCCCCC